MSGIPEVIPIRKKNATDGSLLSEVILRVSYGRGNTHQYPRKCRRIGVNEPIIVECQERETLVEALLVGNEVLIVQVVLEQIDLLVDCKNQRLIPNPEPLTIQALHH